MSGGGVADSSATGIRTFHLFFFFQAEDGIRYVAVTGVQTCALPISAEALEIGASRGGIPRPGLGKDGNFVARHTLQGLGHVWMAAVGIRRVKKPQSMVVTVEKQIGEAFYAERGLVRMMAAADRSRAHRQSAGLDARASEPNGVRSAELSCLRRQRKGLLRGRLGIEPNRSRRVRRSMQKLAPLHLAGVYCGFVRQIPKSSFLCSLRR